MSFGVSRGAENECGDCMGVGDWEEKRASVTIDLMSMLNLWVRGEAFGSRLDSLISQKCDGHRMCQIADKICATYLSGSKDEI